MLLRMFLCEFISMGFATANDDELKYYQKPAGETGKVHAEEQCGEGPHELLGCEISSPSGFP